MGRPVLSVVLLAAMVVAAGCLSKDEPAPAGTASTAADVGPDGPAATPSSTNATEGANTTASGNSTGASDMPSNPGNCMRGMAMPGCTEAQAEAYFAAREVDAPPPDKPLTPIVIVMDAQGANAAGAFTLDNGTMVLLVEIVISNTGQGPYAALSAGDMGEVTLDLIGPVETLTLALGGPYIGVDPVNVLSKKSTATVQMPAIGDWTVALHGQGANAQVELRLIERFSM